MNGQRSEIRENCWIEIEDQALETGPKEADAPSRPDTADTKAPAKVTPYGVVIQTPRGEVVKRERPRSGLALPFPQPSRQQPFGVGHLG